MGGIIFIFGVKKIHSIAVNFSLVTLCGFILQSLNIIVDPEERTYIANAYPEDLIDVLYLDVVS